VRLAGFHQGVEVQDVVGAGEVHVDAAGLVGVA